MVGCSARLWGGSARWRLYMRCWLRWRKGAGRWSAWSGEPGLGKSRLVHEFRRSLGGRRLTYRAGRCLSYGSTTPYLPVLDLLRHHCGITDTDGPEDITAKIHRSLQEVDMAPETWAPVLLHLLGLQEGTNALAALSPEARKARILTALTQMCLKGSQQRPLILEIEDLHWIDPSSDACLAALVERMAGAPLLVLVTYRPGYRPAWIDRSYVTQVALQPLTSQDSLRVVQAVLPTAALSAPLVPQLLAKADGNPFFLEELARTVVEQGADAPAPPCPTRSRPCCWPASTGYRPLPSACSRPRQSSARTSLCPVAGRDRSA